MIKLPIERKVQKRKGLLETHPLGPIEKEFKTMPNTDDHYQMDKKRGKKQSGVSNNIRFGRNSISQGDGFLGVSRPEMLRTSSFKSSEEEK